MPSLTSVELHVDNYPIISASGNLRRLELLELNMLSCSTTGFSVHLFAGLFSRISCLKLVMPLETMVISMEDLPETGPWEITKLDIEPEAIPLSARWPELRELTVGCDRDFVRQVSMRSIMRCSKLEVLRLNLSFASLSDHVKVLTPVASLRRLEVAVGFLDEIELLRSDQSAFQGAMPSCRLKLGHL